MSGIELIGLAASILQIADLGWKSSYKLYAFSKKVHDAGKAIELVSQDIAATGAVLKQLGEEVKKDEETTPTSRLSTQGLIGAASKLVDECQTLFKEIDQGITGEEGSKVILGFKQKLKWSYLEPRLDLLRTNLERLKSSLALMLNVLIYAEQQRSRQGAAVLKEQQKLVASLAEQKNDSEKRIEELNKRIEAPARVASPEVVKSSAQTISNTVTPSTARPIMDSRLQNPRTGMNVATTRTSFSAGMSAVKISPLHSPTKSAPPARISRKAVPVRASLTNVDQSVRHQPSESVEQPSHLDHHRLLIENLLKEVNSSKYALDHGLRYRLHDGVLELHWREWQPLRETYGDQMLQAILSKSPVLARHWYDMATRTEALNPPNVTLKSARNQISNPRPLTLEAGRQPASTMDQQPAGIPAGIQRIASHLDPSQQIRLQSENAVPSNQPQMQRPDTLQPDSEGSNTEQLFNLDFSSLENSDVLKDFDFDSFLRTSDDDTFNFDSAIATTGDFRATQPMLDSNAVATRVDRKDDVIHRNPQERLDLEHQQARPRRYGYTSGNNASQVVGYGANVDRPLKAEDEDEEDVTVLKDEIKFIKQEDVHSTRNALRLATQAEETGRNTLARLGTQGEACYSTDENLNSGSHQTDTAVNKAKELKTLNRSMFAVRASNDLSTISRGQGHSKVSEDATIAKKKILAAQRAKYQFEADSEDDEIEGEIDANLDYLGGAAKRLNLLSRATGHEVESPLAKVQLKSERVDGDMFFSDPAASIANRFLKEWTTVEPIININTERLKRIR